MLSRSLLERISELAKAVPEREICGLLLGQGDRVTDILPAANVAADPARNFEVDPAVLIAAHRAARHGGAKVLGHYHSHPSGISEPSLADAEAAPADGALWLVVGGGGEMRLWRAGEAGLHGRFAPVTILNDDDAATIAAFMRGSMPVEQVPGIAEIRLHKAVPESGVGRIGQGPAPYWAYHWGGGLALARFVLDHPEWVFGHRVLDLGAGSGLVGIAAAMAGASHVVAVDIDPSAVVAIAANAELNGVALEGRCGQLLDLAPPSGVDVVLVGDLFYDRVLADQVATFLDRCVAVGLTVLVGDPYRPTLPRKSLTLLAEYPVSETAGKTVSAGVFRYG